VTTRIKRDFATLDSGLGSDDLEVAKLRIIANRRAEAASRRQRRLDEGSACAFVR